MTAATAPLLAQAGKYLAFELAHEEYGVGILRVREITTAAGLTPVPDQPACVPGAIVLRGRKVPVVSLRHRLGLGAADDPGSACVVVVEMQSPAGPQIVGLLVDAVTEVRCFDADEIDAPPGLGGGLEEGDWIAGIGRGENRNVCLIDVDRLLIRSEWEQLERSHGGSAAH